MNRFLQRFGALALPTALTLVAGVLGSPAFAQSAAENIQPVGQVCLAGQPCVGQPVAGGAPGPNSAAPAAEPVPAQAAPADPAPAATQTASSSARDFDAAATYNQYCMACHMTGAAGAPQLDDEEAWNTRLEKGMDAVMQNVINGIGAMPARGLCNDCNDEQLRAIVDYMVSQ